MNHTSKRQYRSAPDVPKDKSKIPFTLTVRGEWDWNKDIAPADFESDGLAYELSNIDGNFRDAFLQWLADRIFSRLDNMFIDVKLTFMSVSPEIERVFSGLQKEKSEANQAAAKKRLSQLEAEAAKLRKELR